MPQETDLRMLHITNFNTFLESNGFSYSGLVTQRSAEKHCWTNPTGHEIYFPNSRPKINDVELHLPKGSGALKDERAHVLAGIDAIRAVTALHHGEGAQQKITTNRGKVIAACPMAGISWGLPGFKDRGTLPKAALNDCGDYEFKFDRLPLLGQRILLDANVRSALSLKKPRHTQKGSVTVKKWISNPHVTISMSRTESWHGYWKPMDSRKITDPSTRAVSECLSQHPTELVLATTVMPEGALSRAEPPAPTAPSRGVSRMKRG